MDFSYNKGKFNCMCISLISTTTRWVHLVFHCAHSLWMPHLSMYKHTCVCVGWGHWVDDLNLSNKLFNLQGKRSFPYSNLTSISFQPIRSTNCHSSNRHIATLSALCLLSYLSHWAVAKSQTGRSVLSWIKQDYWIPVCGERDRGRRERQEGVPRSNEVKPALFFLLLFSPSHQLSPYRVFSRDKVAEDTESLQKPRVCVYTVCFQSVLACNAHTHTHTMNQSEAGCLSEYECSRWSHAQLMWEMCEGGPGMGK